MNIYAVIHSDAGDVFCTYSAMPEESVRALWAPFSVEFVDAGTYQERSDAVADHGL